MTHHSGSWAHPPRKPRTWRADLADNLNTLVTVLVAVAIPTAIIIVVLKHAGVL